jgi:hypothetical protein
MHTPEFLTFDSRNPIPRATVVEVARDLRAQLPNHKIGNYLETKPHVLAESEFLTLVRVAGTYVGIASGNMYRVRTRELFYAETLLLSESLHDQKISYAQIGALFRCVYAVRQQMPSLVAAKTFNARSYALVRKLARACGARMYPEIGADNLPELEQLACELAEVLAPGLEFEPRYGVVRGGGGGVAEDFWPSQPLARAKDINEVFAHHLTPRDRMLCVVDTSDEGVQRRLVEMFFAESAIEIEKDDNKFEMTAPSPGSKQQ